LQQRKPRFPDFRKFNWFGAYGEGWALYTESLGKNWDCILIRTNISGC
jgi:uncharacterized protein (DUF885 family)